MPDSIVNTNKVSPANHNRCPWEKPTSYLVKDDNVEIGWREESSHRRPSDLLLVPRIRVEVDAWRKNSYQGASDVTRHLFRYWFEEDHDVSIFESPFRYYFGQRESIETLAWLTEITKIRNTKELIESFGGFTQKDLNSNKLEFQIMVDGKRQIGRDLPDQTKNNIQDFPSDNLRRYAFKMATGSGKTWVMALVIVWSYFHRQFVSDAEFSNNFLIVASNSIVYQRLKKDFVDNRIFNDLPLIPPEWKESFSLNVILQEDVGNVENSKNLFLSNIQGLHETKETNLTSIYERVKCIDNLLVIIDEAHHVHDDGLAWIQALHSINSVLPNGFNVWLDFSATPKDKNGLYFPWTIVDYPLAQAVEDNIVKIPVIMNSEVDKIQPIKDPENVRRENVTEKYRYWIKASVGRLKEHQDIYEKVNMRPILFILVDKNDYVDDIGEYLWKNKEFNFKKSEVLVIHTESSGEIKKEDLETTRQVVSDIDSKQSEIKVIVSVVMLREGWNLGNVTLVLGLSSITASSENTPNHVIGRGLRLMVQGSPDMTQTLEIFGTRIFLDQLRSQLDSEGVCISNIPFTQSLPVVIKPVLKRIEYDIQIPQVKKIVNSDFRLLAKKNVKLLSPIFTQNELGKSLQCRLKTDFASTKTLVYEMHSTPEHILSSRELVKLVVNKFICYAKLPNRVTEVYPIVQKYVSDRCFGKRVELETNKVRSYLAMNEIQNAIAKYLARKHAEFTIEEQVIEFEDRNVRLSQTKPYSWRRDLPPYIGKKSIFNYVATFNNYERQFAEYLDRASDVLRFAAFGATEKGGSGTAFRVGYLKPNGIKGFYYPDWIVVQKSDDNEVIWIVDTKKRVWEDKEIRELAIEEWCEQVSLIDDKTWNYIRVEQKEFDSNWNSLRKMIVTIIGRELIKVRDERNIVVTQDELRKWREEGRA